MCQVVDERVVINRDAVLVTQLELPSQAVLPVPDAERFGHRVEKGDRRGSVK
jgi:hypothetical protein